MTTEAKDHRDTWQPPPRPEWVQRVNEEGYCMNISGVVPLDSKSLREAAIRSTGLSNFGVDDWREPFEVLVKAMDEEADLNLMGRIRTRSEILNSLEARLQIEETYRQHPEIDDQKVAQPIIIVGQGRSGTSFLQNVLSMNPDNGSLLTWEIMFPCPPPETATYKTDPRIEKSHRMIDQWNRVTPTITAIHEFGGALPMEDCQMMAMNFTAPSWFGSLGQTPSYDAYMATCDMEPAMRYHQRVLKLLQWKNPRKNWVLKDPMHLDRLGLMHKFYPDACFVWPHRDPVKALASTISIIGHVQWGRCDHPFKGGSFEYVVDPFLSAGRFNAVIDRLEAGEVPPAQFHNLLYKDLVGDTMTVIDRMYAHFSIPLSDYGRAAMVKYLADNPREARPAHKVQAGTDAATLRAREAYKRYQDYFNIPNE